MSPLYATSLLPFIPGGKDFAASRRLFAELGFFDEIWTASGLVGMRNGDVRFILQDFHNDEFASNLMMKLVVPDLDLWWTAVAAKDLPAAYPGFRINPPKDIPGAAR